MPLEPSTRLGSYEIIALVGAGGMGEVYRARDTRLGRDVAVKVLPAAFASDGDWRQRLEREARTISALSHPNICHLYDVGHHEGIDFLVMEYLEGETLADRLSRGPLPVDQVLRFGIEIAAALHAAHQRGIVHRDLKPGNVMLGKTGVRLLDFGLAKPVAAPLGGGMPGATVTAPLTSGGMLIGTFQYMSPEQADGREADARSDIFALGAVLYEMATGRRAFDGRSPASVIAAILEREPPPVSSLQPISPLLLDDLVAGCLAKDPDERWQTAHDVRLQLQAIARQAGTARRAGPAGAEMRRRRATYAALGLAGLLMVVGAAFAGRLSAPGAEQGAVMRAAILPPPAHSFVPNDFALSPDGRRLAFVASSAESGSTLWVQSLDSAQAQPIPGSAGASTPFWSPDSRSVAFFTSDGLLRVEPGGGAVERVASVMLPAGGGTWGPTDTILFSPTVQGPIYRVGASGGTPVPVTHVPADRAGEAHRFPQFLADGRRFLYVAAWTTEQRGGLFLASLDDPEPRLLSTEIRGRILLAGDHLLFDRAGVLYAQPFDHQRGAPIGTPRVILRNEIVTDWRFGNLPLAASVTGTLVFQSRLTYRTELVRYDRSGNELGTVGPPNLWSPALSPDGRRLAAAYDRAGTGQYNIWVEDLQRGMGALLTNEGIDSAHRWSDDGRWLVYSSIRETHEGIFRRPVDGSGQEERLVDSQAHLLLNDHARDGSRFLYMDFSGGDPGIRSYEFASRETELLVEFGAEATYSPDGQWLAYLEFPVGLRVTRANERGAPRVQLSGGPGSQIRWRGDGRELYFVAPDKQLMAVSLAVGKDRLPEPSVPRPLFRTRIVQPRLSLFQYDVTTDGQTFIINSLPREDAAAPLTVLTNWTALR
jgi:eukaryotic-like serine/threonine-protein kinase